MRGERNAPGSKKQTSVVLGTAADLVHGDRGEDYGHPSEDFARTAAMWSDILGCPVNKKQVALCMIAVKISRLFNSPRHVDSRVDIAGYAETYAMVLEREDAE